MNVKRLDNKVYVLTWLVCGFAETLRAERDFMATSITAYVYRIGCDYY